ncbi:serine/threonine-protein kinase-like protein CCR4 [Dendrobium catenatum]|uniref:Serine/threonine-protein kinase-like protein CCR4 n=1 Tax=Dendrobium catenatum TaxID=906689 RepID=A0A2I0VBE9_9ASPA|nr:serine/threonine-protein kinase-like protein CCR4 [Dendrobium catenatum]PKU60727.1 Serine/threonine-protein kinase-like protein CCR4 [Dendrobium catenatum]
MSSPFPLLIHLLVFISSLLFSPVSFVSSYPLSTIAISQVGNQTVICALQPSSDGGPYALNCKALPSGKRHTYSSSGGFLYSAVAAGNGFLCALSSEQANQSISTMRWWDFSQTPAPSKRVYKGPSLTALASGDFHVCGLIGGSGKPNCWRWPELIIPSDLRFTAISVGGDFVCGLHDSSIARCFGSNASGVVGNEPKGEFASIAAGTQHACAVSISGELVCWGAGAPQGTVSEVSSLALGDGRTCAIRINGTVSCLGAGAELPPDFETAQFMSVEARGGAFCGVLTENYSVICWGNDVFHQNHVVFNQVLPGSCLPISTCRCGVLPGSGNTCGHSEAICQSCPRPFPPPPPPLSPPPRKPPPPSAQQAASISPTHSSNRRQLLFILLGAVGFGIGCLASACFLIIRAKNQSGRVHDSGRVPPATNAADPGINLSLSRLFTKGPSPMVEEYTIEALLAATEGFAEKHKIGSGGFGSVYRATLPNGRIVAIKRAKPPPAAARTPTASTSRSVPLRRREMETAFLAELALLSRVNHKNLVRLYGFCREGAELILVYEFMTRGTLDAHLRLPGPPGSPLESWAGRIRIALDAARGIEYLHAYAVPTIIHRDIKSSNILLDDDWTAKVSDFGLSLLNPKEGEVEEEDEDGAAAAAAGTVGYMDPEYYRLRHLTAKSDVYSFGVVLLELLTGSKAVERSAESGTPRNLVEHAVPRIEVDEVHCVLDGRLPPPTPCEIEAVTYVGYLAADCVSPVGMDRPSMTEVVAGLERALLACLGACGATNQTGTGPTGFTRATEERSG